MVSKTCDVAHFHTSISYFLLLSYTHTHTHSLVLSRSVTPRPKQTLQEHICYFSFTLLSNHNIPFLTQRASAQPEVSPRQLCILIWASRGREGGPDFGFGSTNVTEPTDPGGGARAAQTCCAASRRRSGKFFVLLGLCDSLCLRVCVCVRMLTSTHSDDPVSVCQWGNWGKLVCTAAS